MYRLSFMGNEELRESWLLFAHLVASGTSATEAYLRAGYRRSTGDTIPDRPKLPPNP